MFTNKEWLIFLAGAQAFHTLTHIFLYFSNTLPLTVYNMQVTRDLNLWAIGINALITIGLLWWIKNY